MLLGFSQTASGCMAPALCETNPDTGIIIESLVDNAGSQLTCTKGESVGGISFAAVTTGFLSNFHFSAE